MQSPSQRKHKRNSIFPVEGKRRAHIHAVEASCAMLRRAAEAAGARDAEPLRSERDPAPVWAGRWWHPAAAACAEGSAQLRGKHAANLPTLSLYKISGDFNVHLYVHTSPQYQPSSTATSMKNEFLSSNSKSHFLNKLGKSHLRSSSGLKEKGFQNDGLEVQLFIYTSRKEFSDLKVYNNHLFRWQIQHWYAPCQEAGVKK